MRVLASILNLEHLRSTLGWMLAVCIESANSSTPPYFYFAFSLAHCSTSKNFHPTTFSFIFSVSTIDSLSSKPDPMLEGFYGSTIAGTF
jgi:hypothetical protein